MAKRLPIDADHPAYAPGACDADGRPLCRRCLQAFTAGIGEFCSYACIHEFRIRSSPAYARKAVYQRDRGVCTHCRLDCGLLDRALRRLVAGAPEADPEAGRRQALELIAALGFGRRTRVISLWQADHRIAVAEGGRDCGLGNYRTLCLNCHALQTGELHQRLRRAREG
jgi:5-methylcytosine-specific restriction protein A